MLGYNYADRLATLQDAPEGESSPHLYALCVRCADKLTPPKGWLLEDMRSNPVLFIPTPEPVGAFRSP